jgi:1-pyrroline-5-carboxylate dehydrogenase
MDAVTQIPAPENEPIMQYAPASPERADLEAALAELQAAPRDLPHTISGRRVVGSGEPLDVRQPHAYRKVLGTLRNATAEDARSAVDAAMAAGPAWRALSFDDRAAIFLKAAELLSGPWRAGSTPRRCSARARPCYQAEIDSACELIDFWRINAYFARQILAEQPPLNAKGSGTAPTTGRSRVRLRDHALQLHGDCRQPADGARAYG